MPSSEHPTTKTNTDTRYFAIWRKMGITPSPSIPTKKKFWDRKYTRHWQATKKRSMSRFSLFHLRLPRYCSRKWKHCRFLTYGCSHEVKVMQRFLFAKKTISIAHITHASWSREAKKNHHIFLSSQARKQSIWQIYIFRYNINNKIKTKIEKEIYPLSKKYGAIRKLLQRKHMMRNRAEYCRRHTRKNQFLPNRTLHLFHRRKSRNTIIEKNIKT
jgi:hypothetical protein